MTDRDYNRGGRLIKPTGYTDDPSSANAVTQETDYEYNLAEARTRVNYPDDTSTDRGFEEMFYDAALRLTKRINSEGQRHRLRPRCHGPEDESDDAGQGGHLHL